MTVFIIMLAVVLLYWTVEAVWIHRAVRAIPIRIHVNGSRGKSSVTRLVAAALRESGIRTVAKTTGSRARLILPDGSEEAVVRLGTPNIAEQVGVLDRARREGAEALVMECMAVRPDLQQISEERILHSTIGVVTNVRPDHLDVMGPTLADVAMAISSTIPRKGRVVAGETREFKYLEREAARRGSTFETVRSELLAPSIMEGFGYLEHAENVAAALAVTRSLGVPDEVSLQGMYRVTPDSGACTRWHLEHRGTPIEFQNIFAANDLESTISIWERLGLGEPEEGPTIALLNLRGDRIDRSIQFAEAVEARLKADYYVVVGEISNSVRRRFERQVPPGQLLALGRVRPVEIFDRLAEIGRPRARVGGVGNIGGLGHEILAFLSQSRETRC
jgi:poly-gamma-glutamate synthase PgsB/CapB